MTPKFLTNQEAQKRIAELETLQAKGGTVTNAAPDPGKAAAAVKARLDAAKAKFAAAEATARAKQAAAAVAPALTTAKEFAGEPKRMTREEFRKLSAPDRARFIREGGKITD